MSSCFDTIDFSYPFASISNCFPSILIICIHKQSSLKLKKCSKLKICFETETHIETIGPGASRGSSFDSKMLRIVCCCKLISLRNKSKISNSFNYSCFAMHSGCYHYSISLSFIAFRARVQTQGYFRWTSEWFIY